MDSSDYHQRRYGEYHPSAICGDPLGAFLDFMLEEETEYNHYMFSGTAVHHYLQESGLLTDALADAGFNPMFTEYEVGKRYHLEGGGMITGRADCVTGNGDESMVLDIKYTSLKPEYDNGRLIKYMSQVNTYANMFGADEWCLLMIYSKADNVPDEIDYISGETDEENFEIVKEKARSIHEALTAAGYQDGVRWTKEELVNRDRDFWETIMEHFDEDHVPSYDGELKYTDRDQWVMPYMDSWDGEEESSGLGAFTS